MKLQNLIFNKLGNNFSVMLSNPEIQIMEKIESPITIGNSQFFYEIKGISTINQDSSILKILISLYSRHFDCPIEINFLGNKEIMLNVNEQLKGHFTDGIYIFSFVKEEPVSIFKLSAYNPSFFEFVKEDVYKIKIQESNLIKAVLEISYILN